MRRTAAIMAGCVLLVGGGLLALYGVFAILYRGDNGADTYVDLWGRHVDAALAGGAALAIGALVVFVAIRVLRSGRSS